MKSEEMRIEYTRDVHRGDFHPEQMSTTAAVSLNGAESQMTFPAGEHLVESTHRVSALVIDDQGKTVFSCGDTAHQPLFPRSVIKLLQAIPFVQSGAWKSTGLGDPVLALSCASHRGEKIHLEWAKMWMEGQMIPESWLVCGPHEPSDERSNEERLQQGTSLTRMHNNCVGKHLSMISTALYYKEDPERYFHYNSPTQKRIRDLLSLLTGSDMEQSPWALDGCGVPTHALPMASWARALGIFLQDKKTTAMTSWLPYLPACAEILRALKNYPDLISGRTGLASRLIEITQGRVLAKGGAEGVYAAWDLDQKLVFFLKVEDGAGRAALHALYHLLQTHKCLSDSELSQLKIWAPPLIQNNWSGAKIGQVHIKECQGKQKDETNEKN